MTISLYPQKVGAAILDNTLFFVRGDKPRERPRTNTSTGSENSGHEELLCAKNLRCHIFEIAIIGVRTRSSQNRHETFTRAEVVHDETS